MNELKLRGLLILSKISSDNNLFLKFLTENDQIITGISYGGSSKKNKNIYQIGYFLNLIVKNKNSNFPNSIKAELSEPYYYNVLNNKYKLQALLVIVSLLNISIIEGQKINGLFDLSENILKKIETKKNWITDYFLYLLNLLKLIGYEIDFQLNSNQNFFNLETLQFNDFLTSNSVKFPHMLLNFKEEINKNNANNFFKIFEKILQNHHLNNMNLNIPNNYLKFKKLILNFLTK